jgi:soluble lytic murein transglycosylase-like protein
VAPSRAAALLPTSSPPTTLWAGAAARPADVSSGQRQLLEQNWGLPQQVEVEQATKGATEQRPAAQQEAPPAAEAPAPVYPDNLDGWIREALDIMQENGIPGTYDGLHKNIMRESSGDPNAINNWDINAINGTPSIGLLQVIQPTFDAYHVPGTPHDLYDPVANITAAANYAADRYGSIDNVNGAY